MIFLPSYIKVKQFYTVYSLLKDIYSNLYYTSSSSIPMPDLPHNENEKMNKNCNNTSSPHLLLCSCVSVKERDEQRRERDSNSNRVEVKG